jgi:hypothetical protein
MELGVPDPVPALDTQACCKLDLKMGDVYLPPENYPRNKRDLSQKAAKSGPMPLYLV